MNRFLVRCTVILSNGTSLNWQTTTFSKKDRLSGTDLLKVQDEIQRQHKDSTVFFDLIYKLEVNHE